jgi:hypothetical protein
MRPMGFSRESLIGLIVVIPWTFLIWQGHERNQHPDPFYDFTVTISALILALLIETIIRVHKVSSNVESIRRQGEDATRRLGEALDANNRDLNVLRFATHNVPVTEVNEVWHELLSGLRERYIATNLTRREFVYDKEWGAAALDIQRAKHHYRQVAIQKVFIVENEAELADWLDVWKQQAQAGVSIRHILKSEAQAVREGNPEWKMLEYGFGVFDNRIALLWIVDPHERKNNGARIVYRNQDIAAYSRFFRALYESAKGAY